MPQTRLKLGQTLGLSIDGCSHDGQGVGRWNDLVTFVPGALPGERVTARLRRQAKRHLEADLLSVDQASPDRERPACILADRCGGCSLQHCSAAGQVRLKTDTVQQTLHRLAGIELQLPPLWPAAATLGYRNRALIPLERTAEGQLRAGYYRRGSHRIVNMNHCPVLDPRLDALIAPIKADLEASGWPVDVNLSGDGGLRHLALRVGHHTGEVLITLVSSHGHLPGLEEQGALWMARWPQVVGVGLNLQPRPTNVVLGPQTQLLAGRGWLLERFADIELRIAADTFFQVNTQQAERLVPLLCSFFAVHTEPCIVDAYCGIGTFSLPLAAAGARVVGLELHATSVEQAIANASRNQLGRAAFIQGDVAALLPGQLAQADGVVVDPPRKGLSDATLSALISHGPRRMAYISCNPATLARDLAQLCEPGPYRLLQVQPVDFFPQTSHVECVALLEQRSGS